MTKAKPKARGKGEGTVYQRQSDSRWVGAVTLPGGVRKYVYGKTQAEAIRKRDALRASVAVGVLPSSATLGEWLTFWLDVVAPGTLKATTIDRHRSYVETWIKPTIGNVKLQELQVDHVRAMIRKMEAAKSERTKKPLSARTIIKARAVLQAGLTQAVNDGRVLVNVATRAKPPKIKKAADLRTLTPAEAARIIDKAAGTRERARLAVALMAGLRQGEALALNWDHVALDPDGKSGVIKVAWAATRVRGQGMVVDTPKSIRSQRLVRLGAGATMLLEAWRIESGGVGLVFPGLRGPDVVEDSRRDYEVWKRALVRAGVDHARLHAARGTAESAMASAGPWGPWVAAEQMGHHETVAKVFYNRATPEQIDLTARAQDAIAPGRELAAGATDIIGTKEEA